MTSEHRKDLVSETTPSTELGVDENVAFKSPADEESDCVVPFLQVPCPFSLSLSDDPVDLEEDLEASEGGQAAPEGGHAAPEGDREVSLVRENGESMSSGRVRKRTEAGRELDDVVQLSSEKAGRRTRKKVNYISGLPWG